MTLAYVRKQGANYIGYEEVGGQYSQQTRPLPDGSTVPVLVLVNATADRRFLLTNPAGYSLTYNGLVATIEKRRSRGWQAFGSYTFSRAEGLQVSSGTAAAGEQLSTLTSSGTFGQDPNNLTNARGRLANDRPHMFRIMGSVDVPRTGFVVAANFQHFSGKPWAATTRVSLPQGDQRILLEPPGSRRLLVAVAARPARGEAVPIWRRGAARTADGRAQRAQRHGRGGVGDGQPLQPDLRTAHRVHVPASCHGERAVERWTVNALASFVTLLSRVTGTSPALSETRRVREGVPRAFSP